ncbi:MULTISPECIES: Tad domain-containing protein [Rhodopseudomonas]|uniref:Pilus assembly protein TadG n=1 Tax=Rhodopseudomonas palustris TaxID=1076 RepID=A0A0D7E7L2_RHOPL|nr:MULTISPECIES: Tad domain-containing protein [Rhodopseudomonas]KIZ36586.1 pilus assembly protein TadG [Rhodopseudomonas palustris]MDF3813699.1 Tad domain-containing protein [Rhodopseudomonas sp. BAL398]WOK19813.1 Tad domain-containing protein [Rhodopseudomonas sp. BAL398]
MLPISNLARRFYRNENGNIAVIFALALLPVLILIGCAVDYARATQLRAKLQAAADAASIAAVARQSETAKAFLQMTKDGEVEGGATEAKLMFDGNIDGLTGFTLKEFKATVKKSSSQLTAVTEFTADVPTMFLGVINKTVLTIGGSSTSTSGMPLYIDFYLLLDNSPSMGVGATKADVDIMVEATKNKSSDSKCAFACHDTENSNNYYKLAKSKGVKMRIDRLRDATVQLMDTARSTATYSDQYRMAIYDFNRSASAAQSAAVRKLGALTSNMSDAKIAASSTDLMTVNGQNEYNDQDTSFTEIFKAMDKEIPAAGPGTKNAPQKYLFFVSDGVADEANSSCAKKKTGNRCQSPINTKLCQTIKDSDVKIAVLYTTYLELPTNDWYKEWIAPFNKGPFGPSPNSEIANNMRACSSDGLYFEVSQDEDISAAMNALFQKAVANARISR